VTQEGQASGNTTLVATKLFRDVVKDRVSNICGQVSLLMDLKRNALDIILWHVLEDGGRRLLTNRDQESRNPLMTGQAGKRTNPRPTP
jgi:hypothetical protein